MTYSTSQLQSLLNRSNVHVRDPEGTVAKIYRLIEVGASNITVISDFDHTLSRSHDEEGGRCPVTHEVFGNRERFPEIVEKFVQLEKKYARYEHLTEGEERVEKMEAWWRESNQVIADQGISRSELSDIVKETKIQLREGAAEFMVRLEQQEIPILIFSAGIGDVISLVLEQTMGRIPANSHVISNMMAYDEKDRICIFSDPLIHCFNKSGAMVAEFSPLHSCISSRANILLLGDALGDAQMAQGLGKDEERILKIAFLNSKPEMLSRFTSAFDIVIVDDQTMEIPTEIMKMID
ncbi:hypothetical protein PRIPAC_92893 [Pristionchus pacificus]|uniref:5'-nucleotidase n=1 Tax=Pristionchus pacificus TaxID=54126 RepID=A0A2A6CCY2_PRIPA|nr:hypothetical protein PRIPAC_92893 [Pristionchus pacificus]|eukprot:PDM76054.1 hypothetical protein PRIPAC_39658 [Pristionchus pacificus]